MEIKKEYTFFIAGFIAAIIITGIIYASITPAITGGVVAGQTSQIGEENEITQNTISNSENKEIKKTDETQTTKSEPITKEQNLINTILKLRKASNTNNLVETAEHYNQINTELKGTDLSNRWNDIAACVYEKCEDEKYIALIDSVASKELQNEKNLKIHNLIQTYYLWNGKNEELFSESLTKSNQELNNGETEQLWKKIIECDGCEKAGELVLQTIQATI